MRLERCTLVYSHHQTPLRLRVLFTQRRDALQDTQLPARVHGLEQGAILELAALLVGSSGMDR